MFDNTVTLSNGVVVPQLAPGTLLIDNDKVVELCIRYDIQLGMIVLPKTENPDHMKSNADVEFVISDEDMEVLKNVEHIKDYGEHGFLPVFGGKI